MKNVYFKSARLVFSPPYHLPFLPIRCLFCVLFCVLFVSRRFVSGSARWICSRAVIRSALLLRGLFLDSFFFSSHSLAVDSFFARFVSVTVS